MVERQSEDDFAILANTRMVHCVTFARYDSGRLAWVPQVEMALS